MCSCCPRLRSSRCINSRGSSSPSELPIFLISIFMTVSPGLKAEGVLYRCITRLPRSFNNCFTSPRSRSAHRLQLVDPAGNHRQAAIPELRVPGIEPERLEQFRIMFAAAGGEHFEV